MDSPKKHPCLSCGACCASFRVAFYWREAEAKDAENSVPQGYFEDLDGMSRCMKGTNDKHHPKCIALKGTIGKDGHCSIYENRPSPCRRFEASYENGTQNIRCDEAREKHGLKPLKLIDWRRYRDEEKPDLVL
ncbi:MAG: YkgJ family cysteine cluster protein [Bdellovibrionales bacterium]|nr:YkgJ family cysteine cluster protein [Bdellovibrionales bacterium]